MRGCGGGEWKGEGEGGVLCREGMILEAVGWSLYFYILEAMDGAKAFLAKLTPRYALRMT